MIRVIRARILPKFLCAPGLLFLIGPFSRCVQVLMVVMYPVTLPISMALDYLLGKVKSIKRQTCARADWEKCPRLGERNRIRVRRGEGGVKKEGGGWESSLYPFPKKLTKLSSSDPSLAIDQSPSPTTMLNIALNLKNGIVHFGMLFTTTGG